MLWDYLKTLRLTLQAPCMCAGCAAGAQVSALSMRRIACVPKSHARSPTPTPPTMRGSRPRRLEEKEREGD
jgi:hypothetical protein